MNAQELTERFKGVRKSGKGWMALCPAHEDRHPSLSISEGDDGRVLLNCRTGCKTGDVCAAAGISMADLFNDAPRDKKGLVLECGTRRDLDTLAALRHIGLPGCTPGLDLAQERGLLRFGDWQGNRCWFVTDRTGRNRQGRRLDGQKLKTESGDTVKAKTVYGSKAAWPIGTLETADFPYIAIVEGGPDLLSAHQWMWAEGVDDRVAIVAMLGAGNGFPEDALAAFTGKRVRIFPHVDTAGSKAAVRWQNALRGAGATVDVFLLAGLSKRDGEAVSDLNDLAHLADGSARELRGVRLFEFAGGLA